MSFPAPMPAASRCAQLLDSGRPDGLLGLVRHLTLLQIDPTAAIAPNADLVAWSRLGSPYSPAELESALKDRTLVELLAMIRPSEDMALYRAQMAEWRDESRGWQASLDWVRANDACRRDILSRLTATGPLTSRDLPDTCKVPWGSSGWTNNRNVTQLLEYMVRRGEVAVAGRQSRDRLWDLAERVYPDDPVVPEEEALRVRNMRRLRALGLARARGTQYQVEQAHVGEAGEPAVVAGVKGTWRVDPALLGQPFSGRAALLSPFDRLIHDRKRTVELSSSTTSSRCTSQPQNAAGGTSRYPSSTATGSLGSSTPPRTARPASSGSPRSTRMCPSTRP